MLIKCVAIRKVNPVIALLFLWSHLTFVKVILLYVIIYLAKVPSACLGFSLCSRFIQPNLRKLVCLPTVISTSLLIFILSDSAEMNSRFLAYIFKPQFIQKRDYTVIHVYRSNTLKINDFHFP